MIGSASDDATHRWAASGCQSLTGPVEGSGLGPPDGLVPALDRVATRLADASAAVGSRVVIDPLRELALRAHLAGITRRGRVSCGGATRIVPCADGDLVVALARDSDVELVPALLGHEIDPGIDAAWSAIAARAATTESTEMIERAAVLGIAVARVGNTPAMASGAASAIQVSARRRGDVRADGRPMRRPPRVLDLSSLWAGPLCGQLLGLAGCDVVKLESFRRPDGTRSGHPAVHERLNRGKRCAAVDPTTMRGRAEVAALVAAADVVVEASRPRALAGWGVGPDVTPGPSVWISITGYGYTGERSLHVGFGDDVAAAAGLVATGSGGPWFCADAIADPLTGIVAATEALAALAEGERVHLDIAMSDVARQFAGRAVDSTGVPHHVDPVGLDAFPMMHGPLADLGAHTTEVLHEWCR